MLTKVVMVELEDKPGTLGKAARCLADKNINIDGYVVDRGHVRFLVRDANAAAQCLEGAGYEPQVLDVFELALPNRPGELARLGEELGKAGVNIVTSMGLSAGQAPTRVFVRVSDIEKAKPIIGRIEQSATVPGART